MNIYTFNEYILLFSVRIFHTFINTANLTSFSFGRHGYSEYKYKDGILCEMLPVPLLKDNF